MIRTLVVFFGLIFLSLGCGPAERTEQSAEEAQVEEQSGPTLYERLGGV